MIRYTIIILSFSLLSMTSLLAQNLKKHQWKNRVLLIITSDDNNQLCKAQLKELKEDRSGLLDRKLLAYQIFPDRFRPGIFDLPEWEESTSLFNKYHQRGNDFEVILIGLDGGIKLRKTSLLDRQELYDIIDSMPMRQAEMRNKSYE